jgi:hypothetical protein
MSRMCPSRTSRMAYRIHLDGPPPGHLFDRYFDADWSDRLDDPRMWEKSKISRMPNCGPFVAISKRRLAYYASGRGTSG